MVFAKTDKAASYLSRFLRNDAMEAAAAEKEKETEKETAVGNGDGDGDDGCLTRDRDRDLVRHQMLHQKRKTKTRGVIFVDNLTEKARAKNSQLDAPSSLDFNREYICVVNGAVERETGRLIDYIRINSTNKVNLLFTPIYLAHVI